MKIGIIGTGAIGSTIAHKLVNAGHQVKVNNTTEMSKLKKTAENLEATAATIYDVVKDVDVVIFSTPFSALADLPEDLLNKVPKEVIIVDTTNYYPFRDGEIEALKTKPESVWVSEKLGRPVIKAFNNLLAHTLKNKGKADDDRIAMAISGDNKDHKKTISTLVNQVGFDTVDAGLLSDSWRHLPGTPAYCTELEKPELKEALENANKDKAGDLRDRVMEKFQDFQSVPSHEEIVALNRLVYSQKL
jgi:hypothetical protein